MGFVQVGHHQQTSANYKSKLQFGLDVTKSRTCSKPFPPTATTLDLVTI
jgi:hypothetical protein